MDAFNVKVDLDAMTVYLIAAEFAPHNVSNAAALNDVLAKEHVTNCIEQAAIEAAFAALPQAIKGDKFLIAQGRPPKHGQNGYIEFLVNVSGKPLYDGARLAEDDTEKIDSVDYKNATKIVSVKVGERIAVVHPPTLGVVGENLSGKTLAARDGKPMSLRLGEGVGFLPDGITVIATLEGRPVYNNKTLIISQIFEVNGDVNFDTGNVRFDGYVVVRGGVQDDFTVEARSIEIDGVIGAAKIVCKGNLIVHGGINGKNRALIMCQGNADLKYVSGAKLEIVGNLNVAREIAGSTIWCRGVVRAAKIMGGTVLALHGIEARIFGSELGTPTTLQPGVNYEITRIEETAQIFSKNIAGIIKGLGARFGDYKYFLSLSAAKQAEIREVYTMFCKLRDAIIKLLTARQQLLARTDFQPCAVVIALKTLWHDVVIKTPNCQHTFLRTVKGPAGFVDDINNNTVKVVPYSQVEDLLAAYDTVVAPTEEVKK